MTPSNDSNRKDSEYKPVALELKQFHSLTFDIIIIIIIIIIFWKER